MGFKRENKKLIPDPLTKDIIVRIYDLYLEGKSYQSIANLYNEEIKNYICEQNYGIDKDYDDRDIDI